MGHGPFPEKWRGSLPRTHLLDSCLMMADIQARGFFLRILRLLITLALSLCDLSIFSGHLRGLTY